MVGIGNGNTGPLLRGSNSHQAVNGYPTVYLGYDEFGEAIAGHFIELEGAGTLLNTAGAGEIFALVKPDTIAPSTSGPNALWEFGSQATTFAATDGTIKEGFGISGSPVSVAAEFDPGWNLYNVSRSAGNLTLRLNNVQIHSADPVGAVIFPANCRLGSATADRWFAGLFAEITLHQRVLTAAERTNIVQYFSDKYNLGLVAVGSAEAWDPAWTDEQAEDAVNNNGYWHVQSGGKEIEMAHVADRRSHRVSRWW